MSAETKPYFPFYASDYLADINVQMMSLEEEGCYIRLLAYCWREGSIPADGQLLSKLCKGLTPSKIVIDCFQADLNHACRLVHKRLNAERQKHAEHLKISARGGKASAHKRKTTKRVSEQQCASISLQPKSNLSLSLSLSDTLSKDRVLRDSKSESLEHDLLFDSFWQSYPKKKGKLEAQKAFSRLKATQEFLDTVILPGIERAKKSHQWQNPTYIPNPATWLNGKRWADEEVVTVAKQESKKPYDEFCKSKETDDPTNDPEILESRRRFQELIELQARKRAL